MALRGLSLERNPNWRGGRKTMGAPQRYVLLRVVGSHPRATAAGYVLEHLLVAERAIGKPVPATARIHHIDDHGENNAPTNLVICENHAYHKLLHRRRNAYRAIGDPNGRRCSRCRTYDHLENLRISKDAAVHRECHNAANKRYRAARGGK